MHLYEQFFSLSLWFFERKTYCFASIFLFCPSITIEAFIIIFIFPLLFLSGESFETERKTKFFILLLFHFFHWYSLFAHRTYYVYQDITNSRRYIQIFICTYILVPTVVS